MCLSLHKNALEMHLVLFITVILVKHKDCHMPNQKAIKGVIS